MKRWEISNFEELKSMWKRTTCQSFTIRKELANNLLASGLVKVVDDPTGRPKLTLMPKEAVNGGPMNEVYDILRELSALSRFELAEGAYGKEIRVWPNSASRREGN